MLMNRLHIINTCHRCPYCVSGKGKVEPLFKQDRKNGLLEPHLDDCFLRTEREAVCNRPGGEGESPEDDSGDGRAHEKVLQWNSQYVVYLRF